MSKSKALSLTVLGLPALVSAAFNYFDPRDMKNAPAKLSGTGLYANIGTKVIDTAAKPFEVNSALWSDDAAKKRWIILRPGKHVPYDDATDYFNYPDSTVFVKTFLLARAPGDTVYWETRLLMRKADTSETPVEWYGYSYRWNAAQTDANLVATEPAKGFDTVFYYTDNRGRQTYKKWHFPSQLDCNKCHQVSGKLEGTEMLYGRGVLGFYPAQLKRPINNGGNQVTDLFTKGVFSGTQPTAAQLLNRFRGMKEPIGAGLSPQARFATVDSMARSYIAANCSGCHGHRGEVMGAQGEVQLDYDFFKLHPEMEFNKRRVGDFQLKDTAVYDTNETLFGPSGGAYYRLVVNEWGMDTRPGAIWDMSLPPEGGTPNPNVLLHAGYPAFSAILYRQWSRNGAWSDSGVVARALKYDIQFGLDAEKALALQRQGWLFKRPWGSKSWLDTLGRHGWNMDSIIAMVTAKGDPFFGKDRAQMPPLASFMPDTAALKVLGEWVKNYTSIYVGINPGKPLPLMSGPVLRDRMLYLPLHWQGKIEMLDIRGRRHALKAVGASVYALPVVPPGIYFFRQGTRSFRASLL